MSFDNIYLGTCKHGHLRTPQNTRVWKGGRGPQRYCLDCRKAWRLQHQLAHLKRQRGYSKKSYWKYPTRRYRRHIQRRYSLSENEYDRLNSLQGGVCAICGGLNGKRHHLAVDHNHLTQKVRGLLCNACNWGLGQFRESPERLSAAIAYLKRDIP